MRLLPTPPPICSLPGFGPWDFIASVMDATSAGIDMFAWRERGGIWRRRESEEKQTEWTGFLHNPVIFPFSPSLPSPLLPTFGSGGGEERGSLGHLALVSMCVFFSPLPVDIQSLQSDISTK